ncbi:MAG TPA: heavy metal-associated domain-containing protein [Candidatus Saccharimonadales bacterium]|nr:heavy metal-associated domain-containing protein [Candidatus Saccharimonadales bacterium]
MNKVLGITLVLALCLAGAALACDHGKNASNAAAAGCPGMKDAAMSSSCPGMKDASASASGCPGMKNATAMKSGGACCMQGTKGAMSAAGCAKVQHTSFSVAGLNDEASAAKVRAALAGMASVRMVQCDTKAGTATVCWKANKDMGAVARKLTDAGYRTAVLKADADCPASCPHASKTSKMSKADKVGKPS